MPCARRAHRSWETRRRCTDARCHEYPCCRLHRGDVSASVGESLALKACSCCWRRASPAKLHAGVRCPPSAPVPPGGQATLVIIPPAEKHRKCLLPLRDPATGTMLSVVPSGEPGAGIAEARSFVEFNLLQSAQGLAVQKPIRCGFRRRAKGHDGNFRRGRACHFARDRASRLKEAESEAKFAHVPQTLFPYARWKLEDEKEPRAGANQASSTTSPSARRIPPTRRASNCWASF